ncbi:MAG TPA: hypothetical protein VI699_03170 [Candidatus Acidoferrales bacterium]|nr:hypothetical protein [Candidatus Acidoferrales bacterium]
MAGFVLGAMSTLLWIVGIVWAMIVGGFPFYDPVLLFFIRIGFLTALGAILLGLTGKGKLRWPTVGAALAMGTLWLLAATAE